MDRTIANRGFRLRRRAAVVPGWCALLLLAGCGGDGGAPTTAPAAAPAPAAMALRAVASAAPFGPAEAGKRAPEPIGVTVLDDDGTPLGGAAYRWEADANAGWVYPAEGVTGPGGRISASWVAGSPGDGVLTLTLGEGEPAATAAFETRSVASERPPWGYVTLWLDDADDPTGYSMDLTPLTQPHQTYYAALNVAGEAPPGEFFYGFYMGLQRGGSRYDRQPQFSMWDVLEGQGDAGVIERGEGAVCSSFGGEGTGQKCEFDYPWDVGGTYRFEATWEERDGGIAVTGFVTELATMKRRFLGTLWGSQPLRRAGAAAFVEDFRRTAPTCLAQEVRSAAFRRARVRTTGGGWRPIRTGRLTRDSEDLRNPGTPPCANVAARDHPSGLEIAIGGRTAMDPDISRMRIPE